MRIVLAVAAAALAACAVMKQEPVEVRSATAGTTPRFAVDPYWPKALPGNWILGRSEVGYGRRAQKFTRVE
ncbi:MAG TPA: hypothetical protein VN598_00920 [Usitatibacter sp.]|nr:hypothetical protein [Usitatibacter sp.]